MKRILLMIHSASHEIYQKNVNALIKGYLETNQKYYLLVDILPFCGKVEDKDHKYIESMVIPTPEKDVAGTLFKSIKRVINNKNYDIIIKTNTNTVINTQLIYEFCNSLLFNNNIMYTNVCYSFNHNTDSNFLSWFPSGMFLMAHKDVWKRILKQYDSAIEALNNGYINPSIYHNEEYADNKLVWTGFSDEVLIGACMSLANISVGTLTQTSTLSYAKQKFFQNLITGKGVFGVQLHNDIDSRYACINCKMDIDCDLELGSHDEQYRIQYEPYFISLICNLFKSNIPTQGDLNDLYNTIIYFNQNN